MSNAHTVPEPALDPGDPYARAPQTYPRRGEEMADRVASFGAEETFPDGAVLLKRGQRSADCFPVLKGFVEIVDTEPHGASNLITTHQARQFIGEMDFFNGREMLVSGRSRGDCKVVWVRRPDFRRMVAAEPDIGEIIMRALILRRVGFICHAKGGVVLIGSSHTADTQRLARFMARNSYPYRLLDTDVNADA
jgi:thioredoxin reductase (NADPH)